ncbi:MAG: ABC transporter substrate-binding protein [Nitrospinota bacterium]|nr:MAG: ABC transporter substrate-binding protein [Nitrospinota bacterium]
MQKAFPRGEKPPKVGLKEKGGKKSMRAKEKMNRLDRRTMLKLMAATGTVGMTRALGLGTRTAFAQRRGSNELIAGWNLDQIERLDPAFINTTEQMQIATNIFSGLVYADHNLVPQPDLAESWEVSKDGREWVFKLREGVKFHDGSDFTADDVLFTYNRTNNPKVGSIHRRRLAEIEKVEKLGKYEVRFKLKSPSAAFLMATLSRFPGRAMAIVSRTALEKMGDKQYNVTPVGTGPFRVVEHKVGSKLVLERFDDYFRPGIPKVKRITIIPVPEPETAVSALRTGDIQFHNRPPSQFLDVLRADPNIVIMEGPDPGFQSLELNQNRVEAFKDVRVRLAIAKAINRDELAKRGYFGRVLPDVGPIPAAQKLYFRENKREISAQKYDPDTAIRLWEEAKVGKMKLKLLTSIVRGNLRGAQVLKPLIEQVLPIEFEIEQADPSVYFQRGRQGDYETYLAGSGADVDPNDSLRDFFITKAKFNYFGYSNPTVDVIIEEQFREGNTQRRIALVHLAEDLVMADAPLAFTHHLIEFVAMRSEVKNFRMSPTPTWDFSQITLG